MHNQGSGSRWQQPADYDQAVEMAGVVELPDDGSDALLADLLTGRFEDDDPPGAPR